MLDLLAKKIEQADVYYKKLISNPKRQYEESRIDLMVRGVTSAQLFLWFGQRMKDLTTPERKQGLFLNPIVPAHLEHYALPPYSAGIVKTIGARIAGVRIQADVEIPEFVLEYGDPTYKQLPAVENLGDGSVLFYILQELKDSEDGCLFKLRLLSPAAVPQTLFDEHAEHSAVESRSFITAAFESDEKSSDGMREG
ncbi:hypothetical protein LTR85_000695 [Meristemomyces frigidus]|nr:hypothetical protein LTR85_000695 [Meristemomyces frigidus]